MAQEIERKFLVDRARFNRPSGGIALRQGYIPTHNDAVVRVRIAGDEGFLTLKGATLGMTRSEFEYPVPLADAYAMLDEFCAGPKVEKTRYRIDYASHTWEVDIFEGDNAGLCMAEVELAREDEAVSLPPWVGKEVTGDPRYYNAALAKRPFTRWEAP